MMLAPAVPTTCTQGSCPPDHVFNPATCSCVLRTTPLGRLISRNMDPTRPGVRIPTEPSFPAYADKMVRDQIGAVTARLSDAFAAINEMSGALASVMSVRQEVAQLRARMDAWEGAAPVMHETLQRLQGFDLRMVEMRNLGAEHAARSEEAATHARQAAEVTGRSAQQAAAVLHELRSREMSLARLHANTEQYVSTAAMAAVGTAAEALTAQAVEAAEAKLRETSLRAEAALQHDIAAAEETVRGASSALKAVQAQITQDAASLQELAAAAEEHIMSTVQRAEHDVRSVAAEVQKVKSLAEEASMEVRSVVQEVQEVQHGMRLVSEQLQSDIAAAGQQLQHNVATAGDLLVAESSAGLEKLQARVAAAESKLQLEAAAAERKLHSEAAAAEEKLETESRAAESRLKQEAHRTAERIREDAHQAELRVMEASKNVAETINSAVNDIEAHVESALREVEGDIAQVEQHAADVEEELREARSSAARESAARESAARESAARESAARESAARESAARESAARESTRDAPRLRRASWYDDAPPETSRPAPKAPADDERREAQVEITTHEHLHPEAKQAFTPQPARRIGEAAAARPRGDSLNQPDPLAFRALILQAEGEAQQLHESQRAAQELLDQEQSKLASDESFTRQAVATAQGLAAEANKAAHQAQSAEATQEQLLQEIQQLQQLAMQTPEPIVVRKLEQAEAAAGRVMHEVVQAQAHLHQIAQQYEEAVVIATDSARTVEQERMQVQADQVESAALAAQAAEADALLRDATSTYERQLDGAGSLYTSLRGGQEPLTHAQKHEVEIRAMKALTALGVQAYSKEYARVMSHVRRQADEHHRAVQVTPELVQKLG